MKQTIKCSCGLINYFTAPRGNYKLEVICAYCGKAHPILEYKKVGDIVHPIAPPDDPQQVIKKTPQINPERFSPRVKGIYEDIVERTVATPQDYPGDVSIPDPDPDAPQTAEILTEGPPHRDIQELKLRHFRLVSRASIFCSLVEYAFRGRISKREKKRNALPRNPTVEAVFDRNRKSGPMIDMKKQTEKQKCRGRVEEES